MEQYKVRLGDEKKFFYKVVKHGWKENNKIYYFSPNVPENLIKEYSPEFKTDEGTVFDDFIAAKRYFEVNNPYTYTMWRCKVESYDEIMYSTNLNILFGHWLPPIEIKAQLILRKDIRIDDVLLACLKEDYLKLEENSFWAKGIQLIDEIEVFRK